MMRPVVLDDNTSKDGTPEIHYPGPPDWVLAIEVTTQCRKMNCQRIHNELESLMRYSVFPDKYVDKIDRESDYQSDNPNTDVSNVNRYVLNTKSNCNRDTWNVQTICNTSYTVQVLKEMGNYKLGILGISECRWTGFGRMRTKNETSEGYTIIYSDQHDTHHRGVAFIMNNQSASTLMECHPIN